MPLCTLTINSNADNRHNAHLQQQQNLSAAKHFSMAFANFIDKSAWIFQKDALLTIITGELKFWTVWWKSSAKKNE